MSNIHAFCDGEGMKLLLTICNLSGLGLDDSVGIALYSDDPLVSGSPVALKILYTSEAIDSGKCVDFVFDLEDPLPGEFYVVVNDIGKLNPALDLIEFWPPD